MPYAEQITFKQKDFLEQQKSKRVNKSNMVVQDAVRSIGQQNTETAQASTKNCGKTESSKEQETTNPTQEDYWENHEKNELTVAHACPKKSLIKESKASI